jgi:hypothetical protein
LNTKFTFKQECVGVGRLAASPIFYDNTTGGRKGTKEYVITVYSIYIIHAFQLNVFIYDAIKTKDTYIEIFWYRPFQ